MASSTPPFIDTFAVNQTTTNTSIPFTFWGLPWTRTVADTATITGNQLVLPAWNGVASQEPNVAWEQIDTASQLNLSAYQNLFANIISGSATNLVLNVYLVGVVLPTQVTGVTDGTRARFNLPSSRSTIRTLEIMNVSTSASVTVGVCDLDIATDEPGLSNFDAPQDPGTTQEVDMWGEEGWSQTTGTGTTISGGQASLAEGATGVLFYTSGGSGNFLNWSSYTLVKWAVLSGSGTMQLVVTDSASTVATVCSTIAGGEIVFEFSKFPGGFLFNQVASFSLYNVSCTPTLSAAGRNVRAPGTVVLGNGGAEPHVLCLDGSRLEIYHDGFYRLFEDPATGTRVNIKVVAGYVTEMATLTPEGSAVVDYYADVAIPELSAERVIVRPGATLDAQVTGDLQTATVKAGSFEIVSQAPYRAFAVRNAEYQMKQNVVCGGALAGFVHAVDSLLDASAGPTKELTLGFYDAHAMVCDATAPHAVTFDGKFVAHNQEGVYELFAHNGLSVIASLAVDNRINALRVQRDGVDQLVAAWTRPNGVPSNIFAPDTEVEIRAADGSVTRASTLERDGAAGFDFTFAIDGESELLVRLQANGAASFAATAGDWMESASGMLMERLDAPASNGAAQIGESTTSVYEQALEPHLARQRGLSASGFLPAAARIVIGRAPVFGH